MVERGLEVGTVCCRPTREAAMSSDAWATPTRERTVPKSPARSGQSGVSGQSAPSLVGAEFRFVNRVERMKVRAYLGLKRFPEPKRT